MPKLTIDGNEIEVAPGTSVLQACEQLGIEIPRFCYHDRLSVPANCRMCLVEMERAPKPVASCAMPCADGMVIKTDSEVAKKARKGVMEFLLINHPLDCPICDQGGECDLQDQAVAFGVGKGRYAEEKRAVADKEMGPLIRTVMTRCIQCTRCIRFSREIAGVPDLGAVYRGEHMEITTYVGKAIASELSGNLVDVCPVGALTSAPYAFTARPWELKKTESVDVFDAVGCNIRIDARGGEVLRVLPRLNEDVNEEWIADKSRYAIDGLKRQRLDRPYVRRNGKLQPANWDEAFKAIVDRLNGLDGGKIAAIAGDQVDVETLVAYKDLLAALGSANLDSRQDGAQFDASNRAGYLFNSTIAGIDRADAILLIGTNPRHEAPIINARIRKRYLQGGVQIGLVGEKRELTYGYEHIGTDGAALLKVASGEHPFVQVLKNAKNPMLILGSGVFTRADGAALQKVARNIAVDNNMIRDDWNGFNVLHGAASRVGALDVGFLPGQGGKDVAGILAAAQSGAVAAVFLLAADEIDTGKLGSAFVVYQGHHGDKGAARADVILPGSAYTEKNATFVNTEGRPQLTRLAVFPPGEAKEDWKIVRALSGALGKTLPYDSLAQLRARIAKAWPHLSAIGEITPAVWGDFGDAGPVTVAEPLLSRVANFYMTDPISRASATMARCTETYLGSGDGASAQGRTGTHG